MLRERFIILFIAVKLSVQCGYYQAVSKESTGVITSPGYPNEYKIMDNCIWVFEAPEKYVLEFEIGPINTESAKNDVCQDYVRLTDGGPYKTEVIRLCDTSNTTVIRSNGRHAWLQFWSNYQFVGTGFSANWSVVYTGHNYTTSIPSCSLTEFSCSNKQCVYTSYLCDNVNDCGCDDYQCDEGNCKPTFILNKAQLYCLCVGCGVAIFCVIFTSCLCLERPDVRPECFKKPKDNTCCDVIFKRCRNVDKDNSESKSYQQMMAMIERSRNPLSSGWSSVSVEYSPSQSPRGSKVSNSKTEISTRQSVQLVDSPLEEESL